MTQFAEQNTVAELIEMLTYARPHRSAIEAAFVERFIDPLWVQYDKFGNAHKRIGRAPIVYSCHTDTVHHQEGRQRVSLQDGTVALVGGKRGDCLGADDGAGVWLMSEMVRANVSGLYIFHAGEEHGCLGSKYIANDRADFLDGIDAAIAFDRKGTQDIITHQMGERSCSDAFALSLAAAIGMKYRPDDTGTYTDTASYVDIIGECTNVSVGYEGAHGHGETLNIKHLIKLRNRMVRFDPGLLVFERKPGEREEWYNESTYTDYGGTEFDESLVQMVYEHPELAAKLIERLGGNADDMLREITNKGYYS